ncbi:T-complex protein 11-like protein 1 [Drosophila kikkawai]|uniref:T-complex protein 11-like protein 1 n=1 Tax=Drosophila kikkawai TaxID=30033 RepID=A0A6P4I3J6_DROKI|nr:T-complex protein 11-like protein 1 [Drosophila kikkawai]XP_017017172.1 T-complex protein 11-like protein 1 [Drosophila kikkawai]
MDAQENSGQQQQAKDEHRIRTDSESSVDSLTRFVLPSLDGSPPKIVTLDDMSSMFKDLQNMELAHEIALNPDFKLQQYEPPSNSLEGAIKRNVHKAFWELLREQLERQPPSYDQAIGLLAEIKETFPQLLSRNKERIVAHINEVLDETVIQQQAERGLLDFRAYANFVINILSRSCCPARDEAVAKLREIEDVVDTFRSIFELMSLMKLDMANFMLTLARKEIAANSVEYEKQKFSKYMREYMGNGYSFPATEDWLQRHRAGSNVDETIYNAYMQLIDYPADKEFPELLQIDKDRFSGLSWRAQRLILCASLISIAQSTPIISQRRENRLELSKQLDIIVQDVKNQEQVATAIGSCYEQIRAFVNQALAKEQLPAMSEADQEALKNQVLKLSNKASPVPSLMAKRLDGYVRVALRSNGSIPPPPAGFVDYQEELVAFIASFRRLVSYNHAVFGEHFHQILNKTMQPQTEEAETSPAGDGIATGQAQTAKP